MGFSSGVDKAAQRRSEEAQRRSEAKAEQQASLSRIEAAEAAQKQNRLAEEERRRKKNVQASGRESTILAGDSGNLLGG